ncbi:PLD nuclease N-terminal domain-containing protein [Psychromicrobium lacuslunae]|uniref:Cardiolipin synthase N-terminal domain-containing protein n=1 Tax=Psychromicrobium lacuslunae TaxID=1618207 RepID=A0A0D4BZC3_9MICC|nr:PLD nuclease N-terminal domain-containing protein [Psychromicrobium lacuslunae]AJT41471.1 hypothetical protein UM93_07980 [Psychromicrobium lacuslunae]
MGESVNPIIPFWAEAWQILLAVLFFALALWAWISIARSILTPQYKLLWALIVLALPLLGSASWLLGRRHWQQGFLPRR